MLALPLGDEYNWASMAGPEFPTRFAIFPLPGTVLFPGVQLPLHIFEPRYRQMTADAAQSSGVIGMMLIRPGESPMQMRAPVFPVGCAGRITQLESLPDGRFNFVLVGERRFRVAREVESGRLYRTVEAELLDDLPFDALPPAVRGELDAASQHLQLKMLELAHATLPQHVQTLRTRMRQLDPVQLANQLAFGLDCGAVEKQGLLEGSDARERIELLIRLIEFRRAERATRGPRTVN
jgi:Lon protease-like protein